VGIVSVVVNPDSSGVDFFKLFERRECGGVCDGV